MYVGRHRQAESPTVQDPTISAATMGRPGRGTPGGRTPPLPCPAPGGRWPCREISAWGLAVGLSTDVSAIILIPPPDGIGCPLRLPGPSGRPPSPGRTAPQSALPALLSAHKRAVFRCQGPGSIEGRSAASPAQWGPREGKGVSAEPGTKGGRGAGGWPGATGFNTQCGGWRLSSGQHLHNVWGRNRCGVNRQL